MTQNTNLEPRILARGQQFFSSIRGESPSIFNTKWWTGKVMDWCMSNDAFKVQMFRFVDVLPYLNTSESLTRHIEEYFGTNEAEMPSVLKWGVDGFGRGGKIAAAVLSRSMRSNIEKMARQFIIGENTKEAVKGIAKLRKSGFAVVVDLLGEATVNEKEAQAYARAYHDLLDALAADVKKWKALDGAENGLDFGHAPLVNVAVKPSAFYSQAKPVDQQGSIEAIYDRVAPLYRKVMAMQGFLCIDMEQRAFKDITLALYKKLRSEPEFRGYPHLGVVLQAYLKETDDDLDALLTWATDEHLPISVRLVKGAYWDYETVLARQHGLPVPVWTIKAETDAAFERQARRILQHSEICHLACGSHNIRSISAVMELARELEVPEEKYEFQVLYGMAEPVRKGLLNVAHRVRLYCPYGELLPGMAYLVRRLLENTANESFLRQSFVKDVDMEHLLENPAVTAARHHGERRRDHVEEGGAAGPEPFRNEPVADFTLASVREAFPKAIAQVRRDVVGSLVPLYIGGKELHTEDHVSSVNPAAQGEVVGSVCQAGIEEVEQAVQAAHGAFASWRDTPAGERAQVLFQAASILRRDIFHHSALQVLEVGKQWDQAYADVGEAIDFLEYYGREMLRLNGSRRMGNAPGELNHYFYQPCGVCAVIAPWNFPLAISCGMSAAAMVAGNTVVYKPSNVSPVVGHAMTQVFREAGVPEGVFNYVPGRGAIMGDYLVEHKNVAVIAFTGSLDVGARIMQRANLLRSGQVALKKVICELGGKNAVLVDDDADLDEAVVQIIHSAFAFQGQKCSACSRVIVLDSIYERCLDRLAEAAESLKIGPAEDPANFLGPVVDKAAQQRILDYIEVGKNEGALVVHRTVPKNGCYVPLTIFRGIRPQHRMAQEEIFGPVLSVMRAKDFDDALAMANGTQYALTGSVFSRSPGHLARARQEFRVGNLYLNRGCTGALVERQPFGGFKMSGVGSKAGGPDYLLRFMDPRVVTENTMRRGFTPVFEDDAWDE